MNNYALSLRPLAEEEAAVHARRKKEDSRDERREGRWAQIEINRHWLKEATRGSSKRIEEKKRRRRRVRGEGRGKEKTDAGRISRINGPCRSTKETQYRTLPIAVRLLTCQSLISIPAGPVERSNSKKRDGWRHYERLRIVTVLDPRSAFSC